jgi:hypothetical protein
MTDDEARMIVLQRAVALLAASLTKNVLHQVKQAITSPDDDTKVRAAGDALARLIGFAETPPPPGGVRKWPRRA